MFLLTDALAFLATMANVVKKLNVDPRVRTGDCASPQGYVCAGRDIQETTVETTISAACSVLTEEPVKRQVNTNVNVPLDSLDEDARKRNAASRV